MWVHGYVCMLDEVHGYVCMLDEVHGYVCMLDEVHGYVCMLEAKFVFLSTRDLYTLIHTHRCVVQIDVLYKYWVSMYGD